MERNDLTRIVYRNDYALNIYLPQDCTTCYMILKFQSYIFLAGKKKLHSPLGLKQNRIDPSTLLPII